jgi:hypothetical protein
MMNDEPQRRKGAEKKKRNFAPLRLCGEKFLNADKTYGRCHIKKSRQNTATNIIQIEVLLS